MLFLLATVTTGIGINININIEMASPARLVNNGTGYDSDSTLSEVASQCPSPPPGYHQRFNWKYLPTPSQESSRKGTPGPDESSAMSSDKDGPPPRKRRRTSERAPRTTEYLDLRDSKVQDEEQQEQLDRLLNVLHKRQKIVVVAGAGISVSAGSRFLFYFLFFSFFLFFFFSSFSFFSFIFPSSFLHISFSSVHPSVPFQISYLPAVLLFVLFGRHVLTIRRSPRLSLVNGPLHHSPLRTRSKGRLRQGSLRCLCRV